MCVCVVVVVGAADVVALIATLLLTRKSTKLYAAARAETKQNPIGGKKNEIKTTSSSLQLVAYFCENFISLSFCYAHRFFFFSLLRNMVLKLTVYALIKRKTLSLS